MSKQGIEENLWESNQKCAKGWLIEIGTDSIGLNKHYSVSKSPMTKMPTLYQHYELRIARIRTMIPTRYIAANHLWSAFQIDSGD